LGIDPESEPGLSLRPRIEKFTRCNGHEYVLEAAKETAKRMAGTHGEVADPWPYTVEVVNEALVRGRELYTRFNLYENSLRCKIEVLVTHELGEKWWETPENYLSADDVPKLRRNPRLWKSAVAGDEPEMQELTGALQFLRVLDFGELQAIVRHLFNPVFRHVMVPVALNTGSAPMVPDLSWMTARHKQFASTRNQVMHARVVPKETYGQVRRRLDSMLEALEFDVPKTMANIDSCAGKMAAAI